MATRRVDVENRMGTHTGTNSRSAHAAFEVCGDLTGIDLYRRNAFRILGLPVGASLQSAAKSQKLREMQQKLGIKNAVPHGTDAVLPLSSPPDAEATRRAGDAMQDPVARFVHGCLWFWSTDEGTGSDGSLALLSSAHPAVALRSWQRHLTERLDSVVVQHNIAVLAHALALDLESDLRTAPLSRDQETSRWAFWDIALRTWRELLDSPQFWQRVRTLRDIADDPRLPVDIAHRFRDWLPEVILGTSAKVVVVAATRGAESHELSSTFVDAAAFFLPGGRPDGASKKPSSAAPAAHSNGASTRAHAGGPAQAIELHRRAVLAAHWPQADFDRAVEAELKPVIEQVRDSTAKIAAATPTTAREMLAESLGALTRHSAVAEAALPIQSAHRTALMDLVVESLLDAGIAHGNADKRWSYWLLFNDVLSDLATGAMLKERLAKTGETLRGNVKGAEHDKEFEDAANALKAGQSVNVQMDRQGIRVPQVCTCCLGQPHLEQPCTYTWQETQGLQRVNRTVTFKFPVCRECAAHSGEATRKGFWLITVPAVVAAGLGWLLGANVDDANGWVIAGGSTLGALVVMGLIASKLTLSPLDAKHGCRGQSVRLLPADAHKDVWRVTFANPLYALAFAQANGLRRSRPQSTESYRGPSLLRGTPGTTRIIVTIVLSMIASGIAFALATDGKRPTYRPTYTAPSATPNWTPTPNRPAPSTATTPRPAPQTWQPPPVRSDPNAATKALLSSQIESGKARLQDLEGEVESLDRKLKSIQAEIDLYKSEIDDFESRSRFGGNVNRSAYQAAIDAHNERVESYNLMLGRYRSKYREYKDELDSVNAKVDEYNRLIGR